jgi:hypothetical protein
MHNSKKFLKKHENQSHGAIAELPVLHGGLNSNYYYFKKRMLVYCLREYKELGNIIQTEVHLELPEIPVPANLLG